MIMNSLYSHDCVFTEPKIADHWELCRHEDGRIHMFKFHVGKANMFCMSEGNFYIDLYLLVGVKASEHNGSYSYNTIQYQEGCASCRLYNENYAVSLPKEQLKIIERMAIKKMMKIIQE